MVSGSLKGLMGLTWEALYEIQESISPGLIERELALRTPLRENGRGHNQGMKLADASSQE
jgi:hypothetical protein